MTTDRNSEAAYVPGALDRSMPERIWLQIDTGGLNEQRDEPLPEGCFEHVSWCWEQIGGLEVEYVRADLTPPATIPVAGLEALVERISDSIAHNDESEDWLRGAKTTAETIRDELAQLIKEAK